VNIFASNIITSNFSTSNATACNINANFITATNLAGTIGNIGNQLSVLSNIFTSNITSCNVVALSNNFHTFSNASWKFNDSNIYQGLNEKVIAIGKTNATQKLDVEGTILGSNVSFCNFLIYRGSNIVDSSGKIDFHTWISNKMFSSNATGATIGNLVLTSNATTSTGTAMSLNFKSLFLNNGNIASDFLQHLNELAGNSNFGVTGGDTFNPTTQSSNLLTNWNSVIWKPLYQDTNFNLGFSSNVFFNRFSQLCTTEPSWDYTKTNSGMYKTFNSPFVRSNVVIDFNTYTATLCNVITSNATINFNLTTSNIRTSNIIASNITTSNVYGLNANLSNLWASNVGINQINPLYNLDVNGGARIQNNLIALKDIICTSNISASNIEGRTNMTTSNLWVRTCANLYDNIAGVTNRAIPLQVINTYTAGATGISQISLKVSNSNGINVGSFDQCSAHGSIQAGFDASGIYMSMGCSNWYGFCPDSLTIRNGGNVGIGTSNPAYRLDVSGNTRLNNTFIGDVGWGASFAGFAHSNCISQTNYALLQQSTGQTYLNCATSRTINFRVNNQDTMIMNNNTLGILGANVIEFGQGVSGKEGNAGKIGYQTFTTGALDILGAGTSTRNIKLWDNVTIADKLTITGLTEFGTGGVKVGSGGSTIKTIIGGSVEIGTDNDNYAFADVTLTLGGASANYSVFPSVQQAGSSADSFTIKWHNTSSSGSTNTFRISVYRTDSMGWANIVRVHYLVIVY